MPTLAPLISDRRLLLAAEPECPWANEMVLNPGVTRDPVSGRLHMLFRASGNGQIGGCGSSRYWSFPISLGYAYSDDNGISWEADFSKPAMAPSLKAVPEELSLKDGWGHNTLNYANGCIEDPRLFFFENRCMLIVACRVFPPGAYWLCDDPMQCAPNWARDPSHRLGRAVTENVTVNLLYEVDLDLLARGVYGSAFRFITHLTDPERGENRDVLLFPRKLVIGGSPKVVCLHRPWEGHHYSEDAQNIKPSIWYSVGDSIGQLSGADATHEMLAKPIFTWEKNRIGASAPPIEIEPGTWLVSYHGKQDSQVGYAQSFLIVEEAGESLPIVKHRCPEKLLVPVEYWEQPGRFRTPCVFITSIFPADEENLAVIYGAADERIGMASVNLNTLLHTIRQYDRFGNQFA